MLLLDFYQRGYSQNPPPVPLQEAHRPAILKLRHRPTSVQDVPTCEPLARTDHEPKAHLFSTRCPFFGMVVYGSGRHPSPAGFNTLYSERSLLWLKQRN